LKGVIAAVQHENPEGTMKGTAIIAATSKICNSSRTNIHLIFAAQNIQYDSFIAPALPQDAILSGATIMEVVTFLDPNGNKLYCVGPFRDRAHASRAAAGVERAQAQPQEKPRGSITNRCWQIFELLAGKPRAELIAECARQGINAGTAATQYQRWRKAKLSGNARALASVRA